MLIDQVDFNAFAAQCRSNIFQTYGYNIKKSKMCEALAVAVGSPSHNNLLSRLPLSSEQWQKPESLVRLSDALRTRHGFGVEPDSLITDALSSLAETKGQSQIPSALHTFTPSSWHDFVQRAKAFSWLIEVPEATGQRLLTAIYGYESLDQLREDIELADIPGPYDSEAIWPLHNETYNGRRKVDVTERGFFPLRLIAKHKGIDPQKLPLRYRKVLNIGLFEDDHDRRFELVHSEIEVMQASYGRRANQSNSAEQAYADIVVSDEGIGRIQFTTLGQAIYNTVGEILESAEDNRGEGYVFEAYDRLVGLSKQYPENPWIMASWLYWAFTKLYQGDWSHFIGSSRESGYELDAPPEVKMYGPENAQDLLGIAKQTILNFQKFLGAYQNNILEDNQSFEWRSALFAGGAIAMNCGETTLARRWLRKNWNLTQFDRFGARYYLSAMVLNEGRGRVGKYFKKSTCDVWGWVALAAEAHVKSRLEEARKCFAEALIDTWAAFEPFGGPVEGRDSLRVMNNHCTPAFVEEFIYRTQPFWSRHPDTRAFFTSLCCDGAVRHAVYQYHDLAASQIGSARRLPFDQVQAGRLAREKMANKLRETVNNSVA